MKKIRYSYLLDNERNLEKVLITAFGNIAFLRRTVKAAKRGRNEDCYDGEHKPGKLVKITLETIKE